MPDAVTADLPLWTHALLVGTGFLSGVVNAVAGAGSALTVPALLLSGLDAGSANASNRLSILVQTLAGSARFHHLGVRPWRACLAAVPALTAGGVAGGLLAVAVSPAGLQVVFGALFLLLAALLVWRPRWLTPPPAAALSAAGNSWAAQGALVILGVYGGFVQAGVGIPLLLLLVRRFGWDIVEGNAGKLALTGTFTVAALVVFQGEGQIDWVRGGEVAAGSLLGAVVGADAAVRLGVELIRRAVIVGLLLAAAKMFGAV